MEARQNRSEHHCPRTPEVVFDHQDDYPSPRKATQSIAKKLSTNHETPRQGVRRAETYAGERPGLTTDEPL